MSASVSNPVFGYLPDSSPVHSIVLQDGRASCEIITYGGALRSLKVPDLNGNLVDVLLGFDTLQDYLKQDKYLGALVGRFANRIGGSQFSLNGTLYHLTPNDGKVNHLHGGPGGFSFQLWEIAAQSPNSVTLSLVSPDGQEHYPGTLSVQVTYTLSHQALTISYHAVCDQDTICSLTNHAYFNLSGHDSGNVAEQWIQLYASQYTPIAAGSIPTGEILPVDGTPMDLRTPQPIGAHVDDDFEQLRLARGYDHNWAIDGWDSSLRLFARAWSPKTGILLEALTTLPGVQLYTSNFLAGCPAGKNGAPYENRHAFCLETQHFPDAPNHSRFPSPVLKAGEEYQQTTVYRFGLAEHLS